MLSFMKIIEKYPHTGISTPLSFYYHPNTILQQILSNENMLLFTFSMTFGLTTSDLFKKLRLDFIFELDQYIV